MYVSMYYQLSIIVIVALELLRQEGRDSPVDMMQLHSHAFRMARKGCEIKDKEKEGGEEEGGGVREKEELRVRSKEHLEAALTCARLSEGQDSPIAGEYAMLLSRLYPS